MTPRTVAAVAGAACLALSACGPPAPHYRPPTAPPSSTSPSPAPSPAPSLAGILVLSDPGHVTGLIPADCKATGSTPATVRPDPSCTPGGIDPAVNQSTIGATICVRGWTATVRPPVSETAPLKRAMYGAYGMAAGQASELDHLVPLELGGDNDTANLWPEAGPIPNPKDQVENQLKADVCAHKVTLADAQTAIAGDWTTALAKVGSHLSPRTPVTPARLPAHRTAVVHRIAPPPRSVPVVAAPAGAMAQCTDGTISYSAQHSGTCSHHHGVAVWYR